MYESLYQWIFDSSGPGAVIAILVGGAAFLGYAYMVRWIYMGRYVGDVPKTHVAESPGSEEGGKDDE